MGKIEYFCIKKLFGQYDVKMHLNKVNIYVGENGKGKTTILFCLYCVVSGNLEDLNTIAFDEIQIRIKGKPMFCLTHKDLSKLVSESSMSRNYLLTQRYLEASFKKGDIDRRIELIKNSDLNEAVLNRLVSSISDDYRIPYRSAWEYINNALYDTGTGNAENAVKFKKQIVNNFDERIMYFPTYRRIEEDIDRLGLDIADGRKSAIKSRLIQFGMNDVQKYIENTLNKIKTVSVTSFTKMTGLLLKDYLAGDSFDIPYCADIDRKKLAIALDRIGNEIDDNDKNEIKQIVDNNGVYNAYLFNLIRHLIDSYDNQKLFDDKIRFFCDTCNSYFEGKKYFYDESNVELRIISDNGKDLSLMDLSSGEKQIVSVFAQLYLGEYENTIILFDEPELSLSIKWQRHFMTDVMKTGKCTQLIAVTHSPFIFDNEYDYLAKDIGNCIVEEQ